MEKKEKKGIAQLEELNYVLLCVEECLEECMDHEEPFLP